MQIQHSYSIANEISEVAGPISGVGQHVPSYCGACLKGRRLVTSLGPILEKCLAVSVEFNLFLSHVFPEKSIHISIFLDKFNSISSPSFMNFCRKDKCFTVIVAMELKL